MFEPNKKKEIQFMFHVFSMLSRDTSMTEEAKVQILIGALLQTKLTAKEIHDEIKNGYKNFFSQSSTSASTFIEMAIEHPSINRTIL